MEKEMNDNLKRDQWRLHNYFAKSKEVLIKICQKENVETHQMWNAFV